MFKLVFISALSAQSVAGAFTVRPAVVGECGGQTRLSVLGESQNGQDEAVGPTRFLAGATSSRIDFLRNGFMGGAALGSFVLGLPAQPAVARGRATLEQAYDRYTPRIVAGGKFYAGELRGLISKNDWAGIKAATAEPPKKTRGDRSKEDGGVKERAKQTGEFSDARVLVACDLWAGAFSDNSISPKTKSMREQVENLRLVVNGMNLAAREALGEEKSGGLFGLGAKAPSQAELQKTVRELYVAGGNYWNQYIFAANEALPVSLEKLPYL